MSKCQKIRKKKRTVCLGDMRDRITLEDRSLQAPTNSTRASEGFSNQRNIWATVNTARGVSIFDQSNTETDITHNIYIRYDATVDAQTWVKLEDGRRLRIVDVEDLDERKWFQLLRCTERGIDTVEANSA